MNCLRGFEAAARLGSFHKAADELHLTQSAISQQIRMLESTIGQPLFSREGRSIKLTDAGHDLLSTTQTLLVQLATGVRRLDQYSKPNQLVINTSPAFARHWLVPRLKQFREQNPDVDVWIFTTDAPPDMANQTVDIAIRDDIGPQANCRLTILHHDRLLPVCQASVFALPLEARTTLHGEREMDWSNWQIAGGIDVGQRSTGLNFSDPGVLLDAACEGLGVALVSQLLSRHAIVHGQLLSLSEFSIKGPSWSCSIHQNNEHNPLSKRFCAWLYPLLAD